MALRLILLGVPGSGKGTQGRRLHEHYGVPQIATGEMLREAARNGSPLGIKAMELMDQGMLVPDEVVIGIVKQRIQESDATAGFILDGFPRTIPQAEALDGMLAERSTPLDRALYLSAPIDVITLRLTTRMECPVCHRAYNAVEMKPRTEGRCDDDGTQLVGRADDDMEKVKRRIEIYFEETDVLKGYYADSSRLSEVDANRHPAEVFEDLIAILEKDSGSSEGSTKQ